MRLLAHELSVEPVQVNAARGTSFENEFVRGQVLFLHKPWPEPESYPYSEHLASKARRFELRCQLSFKKEPGEVYFGSEMEEDVQLSWTTRRVAHWVLGVCQMLAHAKGVWLTYRFDMEELSNGDIVRPHCAIPMIAADGVVVTPSGQTPPSITDPVPETPLSERLKVRLNTADTYTFAYWNKNMDFARWMIVGMPLGWSSSFKPFIQGQPVHLVAYTLREASPAGGDPHSDGNKQHLVRMVISEEGGDSEKMAASLGSDRKALRKRRRRGCWLRCAWCR